MLQEAKAGMSVRDVCRKHNVSEQSFYRWKTKYGGMGVIEVKRLRELERENEQLKKIVAEAKRSTFGCSKTSIKKNSEPSRTTTRGDALARLLQDQ
jgi:putative transposase